MSCYQCKDRHVIISEEVSCGCRCHPATDMVNHPLHYNKGGIETIEYMRTRCTPEEFRGYLRCSIMKYTDRAPDKGTELQDYKKARWYLEKMIEELERP